MRRTALAIVTGLVVLATPGVAFAETLSITGAGPTAVEGGLFNTGLVATFTDSGGNDVPSAYLASINWGDGVTSPATISTAGPVMDVSGTHTYAEEGAYTMTVSVTDTVGSVSASAAFGVAVADAPLLPAGAMPAQSFSGSGGTTTSGGTRNALTAFESGIGGVNNGGSPPEQATGFRAVNWDAVALDGSDFGGNSTVISAGNTVAVPGARWRLRGVDFDQRVAVAGDGFAHVNPAVAGLFTPFSPANVAAPFNTNRLTIDVVAPADAQTEPTPQASRGLGIVFTNVEIPNTTRIDYYHQGDLIGTAFAPVAAAHGPSFVGLLFGAPAVTRAVVTLGTAQIFGFDGATPTATSTDGGSANLVALDDLAYAEPAPDGAAGTVPATAGSAVQVQFGQFDDGNPNAGTAGLSARILWGDGTESAGTVAKQGTHFHLTGTHTYAANGTYRASGVVSDLGGAQDRIDAAVAVTGAAPQTTTVTTTATTTTTTVQPVPVPPPACTIRLASSTLSIKHGKHPELKPSVTCDQAASLALRVTATISNGHRRRAVAAATLTLGSASGTATAGRPRTMTVRLSRATVSRLRTAAHRHDKVALKLALTATATSAQRATTTAIPSLKLST